MKKLIFILFLLPLFAMAQSFGGWRIENQSTTTLTGGEILTISNMTANSVVLFTQKESIVPEPGDSLILEVKSLGKALFYAQLRLQVDKAITGAYKDIKASGTGLQRFAISLTDFNVKKANAVRMYIMGNNREGWQITSMYFKKKSAPIIEPPLEVPPVVKPPVDTVAKPPVIVPADTVKREFWYFRSLDPRLILTIKKGAGVDTLDFKLKN